MEDRFPFGDVAPLGGTITGTLQDGTAIDFRFTRPEGGRIVLAPAQVQAIPEPPGFVLFGLGLPAHAWRCRRRGRAGVPRRTPCAA